MRRPSARTIFIAALAVLVLGSVALAHYSLTPLPTTGRHPDILPRHLLLPAAAAVGVAQAMPYPSLRHRLAAAVVLLGAGTVATVVIMFIVGCGFHGACSK